MAISAKRILKQSKTKKPKVRSEKITLIGSSVKKKKKKEKLTETTREEEFLRLNKEGLLSDKELKRLTKKKVGFLETAVRVLSLPEEAVKEIAIEPYVDYKRAVLRDKKGKGISTIKMLTRIPTELIKFVPVSVWDILTRKEDSTIFEKGEKANEYNLGNAADELSKLYSSYYREKGEFGLADKYDSISDTLNTELFNTSVAGIKIAPTVKGVINFAGDVVFDAGLTSGLGSVFKPAKEILRIAPSLSRVQEITEAIDKTGLGKKLAKQIGVTEEEFTKTLIEKIFKNNITKEEAMNIAKSDIVGMFKNSGSQDLEEISKNLVDIINDPVKAAGGLTDDLSSIVRPTAGFKKGYRKRAASYAKQFDETLVKLSEAKTVEEMESLLNEAVSLIPAKRILKDALDPTNLLDDTVLLSKGKLAEYRIADKIMEDKTTKLLRPVRGLYTDFSSGVSDVLAKILKTTLGEAKPIEVIKDWVKINLKPTTIENERFLMDAIKKGRGKIIRTSSDATTVKKVIDFLVKKSDIPSDLKPFIKDDNALMALYEYSGNKKIKAWLSKNEDLKKFVDSVGEVFTTLRKKAGEQGVEIPDNIEKYVHHYIKGTSGTPGDYLKKRIGGTILEKAEEKATKNLEYEFEGSILHSVDQLTKQLSNDVSVIKSNRTAVNVLVNTSSKLKTNPAYTAFETLYDHSKIVELGNIVGSSRLGAVLSLYDDIVPEVTRVLDQINDILKPFNASVVKLEDGLFKVKGQVKVEDVALKIEEVLRNKDVFRTMLRDGSALADIVGTTPTKFKSFIGTWGIHNKDSIKLFNGFDNFQKDLISDFYMLSRSANRELNKDPKFFLKELFQSKKDGTYKLTKKGYEKVIRLYKDKGVDDALVRTLELFKSGPGSQIDNSEVLRFIHNANSIAVSVNLFTPKYVFGSNFLPNAIHTYFIGGLRAFTKKNQSKYTKIVTSVVDSIQDRQLADLGGTMVSKGASAVSDVWRKVFGSLDLKNATPEEVRLFRVVESALVDKVNSVGSLADFGEVKILAKDMTGQPISKKAKEFFKFLPSRVTNGKFLKKAKNTILSDPLGFQRGAMMFDVWQATALADNFLKESAGDTGEAIAKLGKWYKSLDELTPVEQRLARGAFMYYTFNRVNFENVIRSMTTNSKYRYRLKYFTKTLGLMKDRKLAIEQGKLEDSHYLRGEFLVGTTDLFFDFPETALKSASEFGKALYLWDNGGTIDYFKNNLNIPLQIVISSMTNQDPRNGKLIDKLKEDNFAGYKNSYSSPEPKLVALFKNAPKSIQKAVGFRKTANGKYKMDPYINYYFFNKATGTARLWGDIYYFASGGRDEKVDYRDALNFFAGIRVMGKERLERDIMYKSFNDEAKYKNALIESGDKRPLELVIPANKKKRLKRFH